MQTQFHPDENEQFYRTLEMTLVSGDEYVSSVLWNDLVEIRDIWEASSEKRKNKKAIPPPAAVEEFQQKVQSVIEGKESPEEQTTKVYLAALGIDYDSLTPEEFFVLTGILDKSSYKENSINRRGRRQAASRKK